MPRVLLAHGLPLALYLDDHSCFHPTKPGVQDATAPPREGAESRVPSAEAAAGTPSVNDSANTEPAGVPQPAGTKAKEVVQEEEGGSKEREHWRRGLLGMYMSLVSAPFLAIVTYYLLRWGDLARLPVLVIVSFSIGLLSARIVRSITDLAGGFIDHSARQGKENPQTSDQADRPRET